MLKKKKGLKTSLENLQAAEFKTLIKDKVTWPNEVHFFEDNAKWAGVVSSGFLVPGKSNGGVFLLRIMTFYHVLDLGSA